MSGQLPNQDKEERFVDLYKMSLSAETSLNKNDQQIDQAENKRPFICGGKWMKHQSVRWRGGEKKDIQMEWKWKHYRKRKEIQRWKEEDIEKKQ